jgi:hypothetical protein
MGEGMGEGEGVWEAGKRGEESRVEGGGLSSGKADERVGDGLAIGGGRLGQWVEQANQNPLQEAFHFLREMRREWGKVGRIWSESPTAWGKADC